MTEPQLILPGHKFVCCGLVGAASDVVAPVRLGSQTLALPSPPVELDAHMRKALGSLYADRFRKCRLYILAQRPSDKLGIVDEEFSTLEGRCTCVVLGLLLQGSMNLEQPGVRIGGSHHEGVVQVRKTQQPPGVLLVPGNAMAHGRRRGSPRSRLGRRRDSDFERRTRQLRSIQARTAGTEEGS